VKPITHLQLVLRLRMSGAVPLLPLYAFTAWRGTPAPFTQFEGMSFFHVGGKEGDRSVLRNDSVNW
jgi:hypothetical protein